MDNKITFRIRSPPVMSPRFLGEIFFEAVIVMASNPQIIQRLNDEQNENISNF